jgi:hypothetical protein
MSGKIIRSQQFEQRKQRRGLTEEEALAIAARARRGEDGDRRSVNSDRVDQAPSLPASPANPIWSCGRCFQIKAALPVTLPEHHASCPQRTEPK